MYRDLEEIRGYRIEGGDGEIGKVVDFHFDDLSYRIRYLVVRTGGWLSGERFLLSPVSVGTPRWEDRTLPVDLTREQVRAGPKPIEDPTVSRRMEIELAQYYSWPAYWQGPLPPPLGRPRTVEIEGDPHLRSAKEVVGYRLLAAGEHVGQVEDLVVEIPEWVILGLVIDTGKWLPGKKVLLSPGSVREIDWAERSVRVSLTPGQIEKSPEFDPRQPVNREWRVLLTDVRGRPVPNSGS